MKINVLYITDLKDGNPHIDISDELLDKYNLFIITEEDSILKFWEIGENGFKILYSIKFIKGFPNFKLLNDYYKEYFSKNNIQLVFLRFEGNRTFRFTKNAQYIVPISYAEENNVPICYGRTSKSLIDFTFKDDVKNINFKESKGVIYTAVFGGYEEIFTPKFINENIDYICFTDDANLKSNFWDIRLVTDLEHLDNTRKARTLKILPHKYLGEYDFSIWVDAGFEIVYDVEKFLNRYSTSAKLLSVRHTERDCIYDEANVCIAAKLDDENKINNQMERYKSEGYPQKNGLIESGVLYRKHKDQQIINVMNDWYYEVMNFSKRDQLSFNYVAWKHKLKFDYAYVLYGKNQFFEHYYHLNMRSYQKTINLFRIFILDNPEVPNLVNSINEINENIPISIITERDDYNFLDKNVEIVSPEKIIGSNIFIKNYHEKYIFIISTKEFIDYKYFEFIYSKLNGGTMYDVFIFDDVTNLVNESYSKFENKTANAEGILFKKEYLENIDVLNIDENFIKKTVLNTVNKKFVSL